MQFQQQGRRVQGHAQEGVRVLQQPVGQVFEPEFAPGQIGPARFPIQAQVVRLATQHQGQGFQAGGDALGRFLPAHGQQAAAHALVHAPAFGQRLDDGKGEDPVGQGGVIQGLV